MWISNLCVIENRRKFKRIISAKNNKIVDHDYKVGDESILNNQASYRYETPYTGPFVINMCCTNGTVELQCGEIKLGIIYIVFNHIHLIKKLDIITQKKLLTTSH